LDTPGSTPRVCAEPVRNVVENAPANNLNGMTTGKTTRFVDIDTTAIAEEILVHFKACCDWSIGVDGLLDVLDAGELINGARLASIKCGEAGAIRALGWACACGATARGEGFTSSGVDTWRNDIIKSLVNEAAIAAIA